LVYVKRLGHWTVIASRFVIDAAMNDIFNTILESFHAHFYET